MGPMIMIAVTSLGLVGLSGKIFPSGMVFMVLGVAFIFYGLHLKSLAIKKFKTNLEQTFLLTVWLSFDRLNHSKKTFNAVP